MFYDVLLHCGSNHTTLDVKGNNTAQPRQVEIEITATGKQFLHIKTNQIPSKYTHDAAYFTRLHTAQFLVRSTVPHATVEDTQNQKGHTTTWNTTDPHSNKTKV